MKLKYIIRKIYELIKMRNMHARTRYVTRTGHVLCYTANTVIPSAIYVLGHSANINLLQAVYIVYSFICPSSKLTISRPKTQIHGAYVQLAELELADLLS